MFACFSLLLVFSTIISIGVTSAIVDSGPHLRVYLTIHSLVICAQMAITRYYITNALHMQTAGGKDLMRFFAWTMIPTAFTINAVEIAIVDPHYDSIYAPATFVLIVIYILFATEMYKAGYIKQPMATSLCVNLFYTIFLLLARAYSYMGDIEYPNLYTIVICLQLATNILMSAILFVALLIATTRTSQFGMRFLAIGTYITICVYVSTGLSSKSPDACIISSLILAVAAILIV